MTSTPSVDDRTCAEATCAGVDAPLTRVFALLGKRWSGMVLGVLLAGPLRYAELSRAVPQVSDRMLSARLSELEGAGLLEREVRPGPPVAVVYGLTALGEDLRPALTELRRWAERHPDVQPGRATPTCPPDPCT